MTYVHNVFESCVLEEKKKDDNFLISDKYPMI